MNAFVVHDGFEQKKTQVGKWYNTDVITHSRRLERYFAPFRKNVVGYDASFRTPYGRKPLVYADWTASGRLYAPIERKLTEEFGPLVGNTHTEATITGTTMTAAYHAAKEIIKRHVNAGREDVVIPVGSGMTGAILKLQRILGLKVPEEWRKKIKIPERLRPVVFVTHMEHHSNHTTWLETIADVEVIRHDEKGLVDLDHLETLFHKYRARKTKIAAVTACSNVTGILTPCHAFARIAHKHGGLCFVDFAAAAPYVPVNMHPKNKLEKLDAIYFSPHKFLGGPGSSGILVFDSRLYHLSSPDQPGGGTITWTNPWGEHHYFKDIELREDGGTPAFLQTIKAGLAIRLKEVMGARNMIAREKELLPHIFKKLCAVRGLTVLAGNIKDRLGIISFIIDGLHYNLGVKLLNDLFGIQTRGGCACAGTYGHYLFHISRRKSKEITKRIDKVDLSEKPGFMRLSIHPVMTNREVEYVCRAVEELAARHRAWSKDYVYNPHTNEFRHRKESKHAQDMRKFFEF